MDMHRRIFFRWQTQETMVDPVVLADGHSYERAAIEAWLAHSATSPLSGLPLEHTRLVPNEPLRRLIASLAAVSV